MNRRFRDEFFEVLIYKVGSRFVEVCVLVVSKKGVFMVMKVIYVYDVYYYGLNVYRGENGYENIIY